MQQEYYGLSSKGYARTQDYSIDAVDFSKQIPVYRVVNEFMNLPDIEENEQSDQIIFLGPQPTLQEQSLSRTHPKLTFLKSSRIMEKDEVDSIHTEQNTVVKIRDKEQSNMKESTIARTEIMVPKNALKYSMNDIRTNKQKDEEEEDVNDAETIYMELEKEKTLRKNLERSYKLLLQKISTKERSYSCQLLDQKSGSDHNLKKKNKNSLKNIGQQSSNFQQFRLSSTLEYRNNAINSARKFEENQPNFSEENYQDEQQLKYFCDQHFKKDFDFRTKIFGELNQIKSKVKYNDLQLFKIQEKCEREKLQMQLKRKEMTIVEKEKDNFKLKELEQEKIEVIPLKQKEQESILGLKGVTVHYFYTFILFLIIAMLVKKG